MVFTHRRPGLWQNRQSPATVRPSTVIRRAKKEACGLQQGPYPHRSSSPVRGPCNAPGLLPLGSGTLRAAANWVTRPGFLNAALQASDWGNSSWLCQSRKGGLYPVPGLEVAQADLEAMGRGMGFRMKVLTHWENLAARGSSEGWDPAGPALGARLAAVSSRRAVMTFVRRQDPVPCSGGGFARRLRVQRESKARAVPRCSLLGPQHVHSTGMGIGARGSSHPGQLTGGHRVAPILHALCQRLQSSGAGGISARSGGHSQGSPQLSWAPEPQAAAVAAERCLPWEHSPSQAGHGRDAQPREQRCCGGESGREGRGRDAGAARELQPCRGHFGAGC